MQQLKSYCVFSQLRNILQSFYCKHNSKPYAETKIGCHDFSDALIHSPWQNNNWFVR